MFLYPFGFHLFGSYSAKAGMVGTYGYAVEIISFMSFENICQALGKGLTSTALVRRAFCPSQRNFRPFRVPLNVIYLTTLFCLRLFARCTLFEMHNDNALIRFSNFFFMIICKPRKLYTHMRRKEDGASLTSPEAKYHINFAFSHFIYPLNCEAGRQISYYQVPSTWFLRAYITF